MGTYTLRGPDGQTHKVEAPPNTPLPQLQRMLDQQLRDQAFAAERRRIRQENAGTLESVTSGIGTGFTGMFESAALGAATLLPEEQELAARERIQDLAERFTPEGGNPESIAMKLGQGIGSMAAFFPAALLPGSVAPMAAALGLATGAGAGEASERARAAGVDEDTRTAAALKGAGIGTLEVLPIARPLGALSRAVPYKQGRKLLNDIAKKMGQQEIKGLKNRAISAAKTGGFEGAQEVVAESLQNMVERGYRPEKEIIEGLGEAGGIGFGSGAIIQAVVDMIVPGRSRGVGDTTPEQEQEQLPEESKRQFDAAMKAVARDNAPEPEGTSADAQYLNDLLRRNDEALRQAMRGDIVDQLPPDARRGTQGDLFEGRADRLRTAEENELAQFEEAMADPVKREAVARDIQAAREREARAERDQQRQIPIDEQIELSRMEEEQAKQEQALADLRTRAETESLDAALVDKRTKASEAARRSVLLNVLNNNTNPDRNVVARNFSEALAAEGFGRTDPTPAELNTIRRAVDFQYARTPGAPAVQPTAVDTGTPDQNAAMEAAVAPRQRAQEAPVQQGLPNIGQRLAPTEQAAPAAPQPRKVTAQMLDDLGVAKTAPVRKLVLDRDLNNPADLAFVEEQLAKYANNPKVRAPVRDNLPGFLAGLRGEQVPMIGPRGGIRKEAETRGQGNRTPTATDTGTSGASVQDTGRGTDGLPAGEPEQRGDTAGAAEPQPTAVADAGDGTPDTEARAPEQPAPLEQPTEPKPAPVAPAPKSEPKQPVAKTKQKESKAKPKTEAKRPAATQKKKKSTPPKKEESVKAKQERQMKELREREAKKGAKKVAQAAETDKTVGLAFRTMGMFPPEYLYHMPKVKMTQRENAMVEGLRDQEPIDPPGKNRNVKFTPDERTVWNRKRAAQVYLKAFKTLEYALAVAAYDVVNKQTAKREKKAADSPYTELTPEDVVKEAIDKAYLGQFNAKNGALAIEWAHMQGLDVGPFVDAVIAYHERRKNLAGRKSPIAIAQITPILDRIQKAREALKKTPPNQKMRDVLADMADKISAAQKRGDKEIVQRTKFLFSDLQANPEQIDKISAELDTLRTPESTGQSYSLSDPAMAEVFDAMDSLPLLEDALDLFYLPMHGTVVQRLEAGNLRGALQALGLTSATNKFANKDFNYVRDIALKFANKIGDTKIKIVKGLKTEEGKRAPGVFDPKTNTIYLDWNYSNNPHVFLHEVAHALTVKTLDNKSHPVTKQLNTIFESVRDQLGTEYGTRNLKEFVAEAYSNPDFQRKLARIFNRQGMSAWQRFVDTISKFIRRMLGKSEKIDPTALEEFRSLVDAILAPAPEYMNHTELEAQVMNDGAASIVNEFGKKYNAAMDGLAQDSDWTETVYNAEEFIRKRLPQTGRRAFLGFMPTQPLADITKNAIKSAIPHKIHRLILGQNGAIWDSFNELSVTLQRMDRFANAHPETMKVLDRIHIRATRLEVDPDKPRSAYKNDPDKQKIWDDMRADWQAMGRAKDKKGVSAQDLYREVRNQYTKLNEMMDTALTTRINKLAEDGDERVKRHASNLVKELQKHKIDPYFPLTREGDYWVMYQVKGEQDPSIVAFATERQKNKFLQALKEDPDVVEGEVRQGSITEMFKLKTGRAETAPTSGFVSDILGIISATQKSITPANAQTQKMLDEQTEMIIRTFIQRLPETAHAKSMIRRMGFAGADEDIRLGFHRRAFNIAREAHQIDYSREMLSEMRELEKHLNELGNKGEIDQKTAQSYLDEWAARVRFATNPPGDWVARLARNANRLAFLGTLGFNVSSAVVNLTQVPMIVAPYLAGKSSWSETVANLKLAYSVFGSSPTDFVMNNLDRSEQERIEGRGLSKSLANYYEVDKTGKVWTVRDDMDINDEKRELLEKLAPMAKELHDSAMDNRSLAYEQLEVDELVTANNMFDAANMWSAYMFHHAERMNRQVSAIASYLTELNRLENNPTPEESNLTGDDLRIRAAKNALYEIQQTNGGAILATAPRWAQRGVGRVAFMFRTFGVQMYYHIIRTGLQAIDKQLPPDQRGIARKQFFNTISTIALLSGAQGIPLYHMVTELIDLFAQDDDELDTDAWVRTVMPGWMYHGGVEELSKLATGGEGLALSPRIGISNILLQTNRFNFDPSVEKSIVQTLGGPFYGYFSSIMRGTKDIGEGNWERGLESIAPAAFRNAWKGAVRYPREGALTRRGDMIMEEMTPGMFLAQMAGFAPAEYVRNQERNQILKGIDRAVNEERTKLLRNLYIELRFGRPSDDVMDKIMKFNNKWPQHRIDPAAVRRSLKQHMETTAKMHDGVLFSPKMQGYLNELSSDLDW